MLLAGNPIYGSYFSRGRESGMSFRGEFVDGSNCVGNFNFLRCIIGTWGFIILFSGVFFVCLKYFVMSLQENMGSCKFLFCLSVPHSF